MADWTPEDHDRIVALFKKGFSQRQISKFTGLPVYVVYNRLVASKLKRKGHAGFVPPDRRLDPMYRANVEPEWEDVDIV